MIAAAFALGLIAAALAGFAWGRSRASAAAYRRGHASAAENMVRPAAADARVRAAAVQARCAVEAAWLRDAVRQQRRFRAVLGEARDWKREAAWCERRASRAEAALRWHADEVRRLREALVADGEKGAKGG